MVDVVKAEFRPPKSKRERAAMVAEALSRAQAILGGRELRVEQQPSTAMSGKSENTPARGSTTQSYESVLDDAPHTVFATTGADQENSGAVARPKDDSPLNNLMRGRRSKCRDGHGRG